MEENNKVDEVLKAEQMPEVEETKDEQPVDEMKETEVIEETTEETQVDSSDKAAEYLERLQRLMAEFDNYRKRIEKEKADSYDFAEIGRAHV